MLGFFDESRAMVTEEGPSGGYPRLKSVRAYEQNLQSFKDMKLRKQLPNMRR